MPNDYSLPPWLTPQGSPWQALVAGVQAGSQIAANRQRGRALAAQIDHQAFQETVLRQKADADAQDLRTLQEWWPTFANAEGEALQTLQVPPLKNAQMWNRLNMAVGEKRQQAAASEVANGMARINFETPEGLADWYSLAGRAIKAGLPMTPEQIYGPPRQAETLRLSREAAAERARHNRATEENALLRMGGQDFEPEIRDVDGERVIRLGQNHWQYLGKAVPEENLPASVRASIYKSQKDTAQKALLDLDKSDPAYATWTAKLQEAEQNMDAMVKGGKAPEAPKRVRVREKSTGKTGWWEGGAVPSEYETIPE